MMNPVIPMGGFGGAALPFRFALPRTAAAPALPTLAIPGLSPAVMAGLAALAATRAKHAAIGGTRQTRFAFTNAAPTTARKMLGGY
jgi:hypothetical protein